MCDDGLKWRECGLVRPVVSLIRQVVSLDRLLLTLDRLLLSLDRLLLLSQVSHHDIPHCQVSQQSNVTYASLSQATNGYKNII